MDPVDRMGWICDLGEGAGADTGSGEGEGVDPGGSKGLDAESGLDVADPGSDLTWWRGQPKVQICLAGWCEAQWEGPPWRRQKNQALFYSFFFSGGGIFRSLKGGDECLTQYSSQYVLQAPVEIDIRSTNKNCSAGLPLITGGGISLIAPFTQQ